MKYELTTPRSTPVVTVGDAKAHLNIDHFDDDALIAMYIEQATDYCQSYTGLSVGQQMWTIYGDTWCDVVSLPVWPVESVVIKYDDTDGNEQLMDSADYVLDDKAQPARLYPAPDTDWPELDVGVNVVRVETTTRAGSMPSQVSAGIYLMTGHLYNNREATGSDRIAEVPLGVNAHLDQVRLF